MEQLEKEEQTKTGGKLQWFFFVVFIPFLFTLSLVLLILTISGINVFEYGKKYAERLPYVSKFVEGTEANTIEQLQKQIVDLKATIVEKEEQVKKVNDSLKQKEAEIDALKQQIERMKAEAEQKASENETMQNEQAAKKGPDIVKMYETMSPRKVAEIIPQMSDKEALDLLSQLKSDRVAAILEKMDAQNAAKYTSMLAKRAKNN